MNINEERVWLIRELMAEDPQYGNMQIPPSQEGQRRLLRGLMNVRMPKPVSDEFRKVQDSYLSKRREEKGTVTLRDMKDCGNGIYLYQGDITTITCDAIVNAANSQMLGCFSPCHGCIDNAIHTYAGIQLRLACSEIMERQEHEEPAGRAKITGGYNLPAKHVIHTVGPVVQYTLTEKHRELLSSCYRSCLQIADENGCASIAFCCISTGVYGYPQRPAAETAVRTVREYREETGSKINVIFNVFKDEDREIYEELLGGETCR